ncbi:MAG: YceI family protein [Saprospiraceae bacterium]|jgi:polyisoprenoid-binding protein YceI|nr:YceI family protein [Saprospiraceae bacterium]
MKLLLFIAGLFVTSSHVVAGTVVPSPKTIDLSTSKVNWKAYKVTGAHEGMMKFKSGNLIFDGETLIGGQLEVDMNTIDVSDLKGAGKGKLEGHLKSEDFFSVVKHPAATINITKVTSRGLPGEYKITANITIKNTTKEIKFNASAKDGAGQATIKLDRSDFDIKYGSGSFFENLGDKTIYDEFDLTVSIAY